jgi:hypothetical protein
MFETTSRRVITQKTEEFRSAAAEVYDLDFLGCLTLKMKSLHSFETAVTTFTSRHGRIHQKT